MKKECSNCEFNFGGTCAGHGDVYKYGDTITDDTKCCDDWGASFDYFCNDTTNAPRFLREALNDCRISYDEFTQMNEDYSSNKDIPINLFDAIKFIYGLSMVDIAVLMNVSFGVVYRAKVQGIPSKRINQFADTLCVSPEALSEQTTAVFPLLRKGKAKLFENNEAINALDDFPNWKQKLSNVISSECLHCPIHLAKNYSRIDKFYWTTEMEMDGFTDSEKQLINYMKKHNAYRKPLISMEYSLDRACMPHIHMSLDNKE